MGLWGGLIRGGPPARGRRRSPRYFFPRAGAVPRVTRVTRETIVRAPPERVFAAIIDPAQRAKWVASMSEAGTGGPMHVGSIVEAKRTAPTSTSRYRMKVLRLDAPRVLEMDVERNGEHVARAGYELHPTAEGTKVRAWGEAQLKGLQKLAAPMVAKGMEDEMTVDLAGLKRHVESG